MGNLTAFAHEMMIDNSQTNSDVGSGTELLRIENLHTHFHSKDGLVKAVNGVNLSIKADTTMGIVGESGSGKSVTALSILRLVPYPGQIVKGSIYFQGVDLLTVDEEELLRIRGGSIAMVFQDPKGSLNPIETIGKQISEILLAHSSMSIREASMRTIELLAELDLSDHVFNQYPFQLSGGQAQRAMIAMATAWHPPILIADEPTSNLDTTVQADVLARLRRIQADEHSAMILITHNLGIVAQMTHEVAVMYAGMIVEYGATNTIFTKPLHPYTWGLLQSTPRLDRPDRPLKPIRGLPPDPLNMPNECPYLNRCPKAINQCRTDPIPMLMEIEPQHYVACYNTIDHEKDI